MQTEPNVPRPLFIAYIIILCWAPLPFGSNRPWAWNLLGILCISLSFVVAIYAIRTKLDLFALLRKYRLSVLLLFFVAIWVTLQCVPISSEILEVFSTNAVTMYEGVIGYEENNTIGKPTISLERGATQQMALLSWTFFLYFVLTLLIVDTPKRLKFLMSAIVLSGLFQALYGTYMTLTGTEYSFFIPKAAYIGRATGTFVNRNHLAGFLEMSLAVGIGLLVASIHEGRRSSWRQMLRRMLDTFLSSKIRLRVYLGLMVIALVLTRSRMGNTAFFISLPVCGLIMMLLQGKLNKKVIILFISLLLIDFLIVGRWFGFEELVDRIETTSFESETRDEVVRDSLTLLQNYKITGTGAGTFYSSFPQYRSSDVRGYYDHAHNDYLEFASTFGIVGFVLLFSLVTFCLYLCFKVLKNRRNPLVKGAAFATLMGIFSLLIHSFVDFNLQIPANAMLFIVLLGIVNITYMTPRKSTSKFSETLSIG